MSKVDCKYWEKCYQKNEQHLEKYNHPPDKEKAQQPPDSTETGKTDLPNLPLKRKASTDEKNEKDTLEPNDGAGDEVSAKSPKYETAELQTEAMGNIAGKNYMEKLRERIKISVQAEYDDLLSTNEFIRHNFLVEMPPDFYAFWNFVLSLKKNSIGEELLLHLDQLFQLQLVGPFEFLAERFHNAPIREPGDYLRHWRFFYDPPEFQTIFVRRETGVHYGYWRDTAQEKENLLIARNDMTKGCEFEFIAGNAFDAFFYYLEKDFPATPFNSAMVGSIKKAAQRFIESNGVSIVKLEKLQKARNINVVTKTFHRAGIVVPVDPKTQVGYRPLMVSDAELKKILKLFEKAGPRDGKKESDDMDDSIKTAVMEKLQPIATAANIAVDECDFGTSLELGMDLFCSGRLELHNLMQSLLVPAYTLLCRPQYIAISKAHMEKRSKSLHLSIFDLDTN